MEEKIKQRKSTGLRDKNNNIIRVGDIIIHTSFPRDKQKVYFLNGEFKVGEILLSAYHNSVIEIIQKESSDLS